MNFTRATLLVFAMTLMTSPVYSNQNLSIEFDRGLEYIKQNKPAKLLKEIKRGTIDCNALSEDKAQSLLSSCIILGELQIAQMLIDHGADINLKHIHGMTPLRIAVSIHNIESTEFLLKNGAQIDAFDLFGISALYQAIIDKNLKITKLLVEYQANINLIANIKGMTWTPLVLATTEDRYEIFDFLIKNGAEVNPETMGSPLLYAANEGSIKMARLLLTNNANPNGECYGGLTPLHQAAYQGHEAMVEFLLDHGAKIDAQSIDGVTPLHYASLRGQVKTVKILLKRGANPNLLVANHGLPLQAALTLNQEQVAELLIPHTKNVNNQDSTRGLTALHTATYKGYEKVVRMLLKQGANPRISSKKGYTAIDVARSEKRTKLVKLFEAEY